MREDSDDELGDEDHPWEWIYEKVSDDEINNSTGRKRKAITVAEQTRTPVGARMGNFVVRIGDTVLLKSPEQGKDWAGLVCAFSEIDEDGEQEMCASIQWFCSPAELVGSRKTKDRPDVLPNESYITADFNMNPLTAINGKAIVMSQDQFLKKYVNGQPPKSKLAAARYGKTILCRRGVKQRTVDFTEEFIWEEKYRGPESMLGLVDWIKDQTKSKTKAAKIETNDQAYQDMEQGSTSQPETPRKRRKITSASTPRSSTKVAKYGTPTHKRIIIKKPLEITPLTTRFLSPSAFTSSPYAHARTNLHVSAVPVSLPCRTNEFSAVYNTLYSAITEGTGTCIYISGTPGTGKTATVREVVSALHQAVAVGDLDYDFNFVEINGMKVTEPSQSYVLLWQALKGDRVSPTHALSLLEHEFSHPSPRRIPTVVLMDELDQLVTKSQSVMYNFFNWPAQRHSRLIVLAVANTMDLPERTLSNKISSRLGLTRITFPGYTHAQLMEIITSRLSNVPGDIVDADAIQFAARKVAAVSGDARRALDICRRAVEIAGQQAAISKPTPPHTNKLRITEETDNADKENDQQHISFSNEEGDNADLQPETPTRKNRNTKFQSHQRESVQSRARVTIPTIKLAISESTTTPLTPYIRTLPLTCKLLLATLLSRHRSTGSTECLFADLITETRRIALSMPEGDPVKEFLLMRSKHNGDGGDVLLPRVDALDTAVEELAAAGVLAVETLAGGAVRGGRRRAARVRLRVEEEEVRDALRSDETGEGRALGVI